MSVDGENLVVGIWWGNDVSWSRGLSVIREQVVMMGCGYTVSYWYYTISITMQAPCLTIIISSRIRFPYQQIILSRTSWTHWLLWIMVFIWKSLSFASTKRCRWLNVPRAGRWSRGWHMTWWSRACDTAPCIVIIQSWGRVDQEYAELNKAVQTYFPGFKVQIIWICLIYAWSEFTEMVDVVNLIDDWDKACRSSMFKLSVYKFFNCFLSPLSSQT